MRAPGSPTVPGIQDFADTRTATRVRVVQDERVPDVPTFPKIYIMIPLGMILITGLVESYQMFPVGEVPDTGSMAEVMSKAVNAAFTIGVKLATPFIVLTLLIYVAMGVLARLMPQVQVFLLALPIQILLSMILLMLVASTLFLTWTAFYENSLTAFFQAASP